MRQFRLHIILFICAVIAFSAVAGALFAHGLTATGLLAALAAFAGALFIGREIRKLIRMMSNFVSALEMNETSLRIEGDGLDSELREMAASMNRIAALYISNRRELETRKLYYDRILRVMTHEMRNSIAPVTALSADISEHPESYSDADLREAVGIIRQSSEGISRFLESYRQLTHLPYPEKRLIDARDFCAQVSRAVVVFAKSINSTEMGNSIVRYELAEGLQLDVDPPLFSQVMINLLKNSLEALAEYRIEKNSEERWSPSVTVRMTRINGAVTVVVEDNGPGMSPAMLADPFQPFVTTKGDGSGIGLFISRQIVRLHGGEMRLSGMPGKGLRVEIVLP